MEYALAALHFLNNVYRAVRPHETKAKKNQSELFEKGRYGMDRIHYNSAIMKLKHVIRDTRIATLEI